MARHYSAYRIMVKRSTESYRNIRNNIHKPIKHIKVNKIFDYFVKNCLHTQGFFIQIFQNHISYETPQNSREYSKCIQEYFFRIHFGFSLQNLLSSTKRSSGFRIVVITTVSECFYGNQRTNMLFNSLGFYNFLIQ